MSRLHTERLELRPLVASDFAQWNEVRQRCRAWLAPWEPRPAPGTPDATRDPQAFGNRCRVRERERSLGTAFDFGLWHNGWFCGEINMSHVARGAFLSAHIGYWIDERLAGRGLAAEGLMAVFGFAFEQIGLHRVQVSIMPSNHASLRVAQKLGLRCEGTSKGYIQIDGIWEDHLRFGLTVEEWQAGRHDMAERLRQARRDQLAARLSRVEHAQSQALEREPTRHSRRSGAEPVAPVQNAPVRNAPVRNAPVRNAPVRNAPVRASAQSFGTDSHS